MKNIITSVLLLLTVRAFSQTGIGTTTPNASAQLDVSSTNKGFLPPRVALTSTTAFAPLAAHVAGMVVYNTASTGDVNPGLYVNNGSAWVIQAGGASSINDLSDGKSNGNNLFLGEYSGFNNTTGQNNVAVGPYSLNTSRYGSNNVAVGQFALTATGTDISATTQGNDNTGLGYYSLINNGVGSKNIAIGSKSGEKIPNNNAHINPNNSIFIGYDTRPSADNEINQIVIGHQAIGNGSNTITLGNSSITGAHAKVAWTVTSDARDKNKFEPLEKGLDFISQLKPYSFEFRKNRDTAETDGIKRFGFKAQDIEALEDGDFVIVDNKDADHLKIKETYLIPILVKAVQELEAENTTLKESIQKQEMVLRELMKRIEGLEKK